MKFRYILLFCFLFLIFNEVYALENFEEKQVISNGTYVINSVLTDYPAFSFNDENVIVDKNIYSYSEAWNINFLNVGYYEIKPYTDNDKYMMVSSDVVASGSNVLIGEGCDDCFYKWIIKDNNDGTYSIVSNNLKYMDVKYGNSSNGTNIWMYDGNNTLAQSFKINNYSDKKTYKGLDISKWQGNIDFNLLAKENPGFIIMRVGRGIRDLGKDVMFDLYYEKASSYDIPIGVYLYSFASNLNEAKDEANYVITWLEGKHLDLPVFYDMEYSGQLYLGKEVLTKIVEEFCSNIILNNYQCGIYANVYWLTNFIDGKELSKNYPIWLAHWTGANDYSSGLFDEYKSGYNLSSYQYW